MNVLTFYYEVFSNVCVVEIIGTSCLLPKNIVLRTLIIDFSWCVVLVLIPSLSISNFKSHSVCRVRFCFWVVQWGCFFTRSGRPPRYILPLSGVTWNLPVRLEYIFQLGQISGRVINFSTALVVISVTFVASDETGTCFCWSMWTLAVKFWLW